MLLTSEDEPTNPYTKSATKLDKSTDTSHHEARQEKLNDQAASGCRKKNLRLLIPKTIPLMGFRRTRNLKLGIWTPGG